MSREDRVPRGRWPWHRGRGVILGYHRIARHDRDPYRLDVAPERFREHLDVLRRRARVVPLAALAEGSIPQRAVALSFDDGYLDNVEAAAPALAAHRFPATFFLVSGALGREEEFWWDRLERAILDPHRLPERFAGRIGGREHEFRVAAHEPRPDDPGWREWCVYFGDCPSPRHELLRALVGLASELTGAERRALAADVAAWAGVDDAPRASHRVATADDLRGLPRRIELGAHSRSHPRLAGLPAPEQREEVAGSKADLERLLGREVRQFAYPHGGRGDYDAISVGAVRAAGFELACANVPGRVEAGAARFELPRHLVYDVDAATFERQLDAWLAGAEAA